MKDGRALLQPLAGYGASGDWRGPDVSRISPVPPVQPPCRWPDVRRGGAGVGPRL